MTSLLRANPGLFISLLLVIAGTVVCLLVGFIVSRSGASLRPIYWFAVFFGLVVIPQFGFHLARAIADRHTAAPRQSALDALAAAAMPTNSNITAPASDVPANLPADAPSPSSSPAARAQAAAQLFGPDVDPALVIDARALFQSALGKAESAQFAAALPGNASALVAQFRGSKEAVEAWVEYLRVTGLNNKSGKGDSERGFAITRPAGDRLYAIPSGAMLYVWTGPDDAAIRHRMAVAGFEPPRRAPLEGGVVEPAATGNEVTPAAQTAKSLLTLKPRTPLAWVLVGSGLAVYLLVVVLWFFKGSSWAASTAPVAGARPVSITELTHRLTALNTRNLPYRIEPTDDPRLWKVSWKYADATWLDVARAHRMRRVHQLTLHLDDAAHRVRVTEFMAAFDASAGADGGRLDWKVARGMMFFQFEHRRVFGAQLGKQGTEPSRLSSAYTFDLQTFKAPFIEAITEAGWEWRPVVWHGPAWLRWATE